MERPDGETEVHGLSIATLNTDEDGTIVRAEIRPFVREEPGVEYSDTPVHIRLGAPAGKEGQTET